MQAGVAKFLNFLKYMKITLQVYFLLMDFMLSKSFLTGSFSKGEFRMFIQNVRRRGKKIRLIANDYGYYSKAIGLE